jgi:hypothetical protein
VRVATLIFLSLLSGCATAVYHPHKTDVEMHADVNLCTTAANKKYWMDPIAALINAYDCLEAKGYSRKNEKLGRQVERTAGGSRAAIRSPALPCRVPCKINK